MFVIIVVVFNLLTNASIGEFMMNDTSFDTPTACEEFKAANHDDIDKHFRGAGVEVGYTNLKIDISCHEVKHHRDI